MKKITTLLFVIASMFSYADEGMLLPNQLKTYYKDMKKAGLRMSYKKIYNENKPSVKDAIVSLGGFCTAEIISPKGLMLTNHHCGYDAIAENSTVENDYLTDGFWAYKMEEEIPIAGLTASIVVRIEDVTDIILSQLNSNLDVDERKLRIKQISNELIDKATKGTHYSAYVKSFYEGNEYYLFVNEVFTDVRLVGAPPSAIGKYGGDTDNWMWTRHTGDFSMFRIYAGQDNKPNDFAMTNKPYTPKYHLPINIKGVKDGDYAMIMGYPGSTDRFLTSYGVKMAIEKDQPSRVKIRGEKLRIMKEDMDNSDEVRLKYASTYAQVSNYWKYFIGQTEQLKKNKVWEKKKAIENDFAEWVNQSEERKKEYGTVLKDIEGAYKILTKFNPTKVYYYEAVYSVGTNQFMIKHNRLLSELQKEEPSKDKLDKLLAYYKKNYKHHFESVNYATELKLLKRLFVMYINDVPQEQYSKKLLELANIKAREKFIKDAMNNSVFTSVEKYEQFIENPDKKTLENDKLFMLNKDLFDNYRKIIYGSEMVKVQEKLDNANRLFVKALREMNPSKKYYPNANSTLRLTYGNVGSYRPKDGVIYDYYTTIDGLMAKEDPNNPEFIVPKKLKELYAKKDYGKYAQDGTLRVNFISNNDITGGNSGSPVMNKKGHLIGCAFDGNWEAMSGDIAFEENLQRTINVDIRYILFIIDKYAGATNLIDEMTIIE
ncbi:MAG TPA: S46 family peptidase [Crocinitomix sp.]|nr:S46 family peptidase [Crocinitomix sp.]